MISTPSPRHWSSIKAPFFYTPEGVKKAPMYLWEILDQVHPDIKLVNLPRGESGQQRTASPVPTACTLPQPAPDATPRRPRRLASPRWPCRTRAAGPTRRALQQACHKDALHSCLAWLANKFTSGLWLQNPEILFPKDQCY